MTIQEQITARLGSLATNLRATIVAITAAIAIVIGFIDAVAAFANHTVPVACMISGYIPWCPKPVESWSDEVGGRGGAEFSALRCGENELLVGVFGKADRTFIYSIGPICAAAQFDWRRKLKSASETVRNGEEIGSDRGNSFSLKCAAGMFAVGYLFDSSVVGTNLGPNEYLVSPLRLRCSSVPATDKPPVVVAMEGTAQSNASRKPFRCPDATSAFGIKGKAGQFVDSIRLGCR